MPEPRGPGLTPWRRLARTLTTTFVVALCSAGSAPAAVVNPGFDGLDGWSSAGTVLNTGSQGVLTDQSGGRTLLWQGLPLVPGSHVLSFDFRVSLSGVGPTGSLPDTLFVSLFFFPSVSSFDPMTITGFSEALGVIDVDPSGVTSSGSGVEVESSEKGSDYRRVSMTFVPGDRYVAPVFELQDLNLVPSNSVVAIDNVNITVVPEPGCIPLAILAATLLVVRRGRTKSACSGN